MARSFRLYTTAQFEQAKTFVDLLAERPDRPLAECDTLSTFRADLIQTLTEDARRASSTARSPVASGARRMRPEPVAANGYTGIYPGRAKQVHQVRRAVTRYLVGCPGADDAVLIVSELAANAVVHSASRDEFFTVRVELYPGYVWVEVEDLGGPWRRRQPDGFPHGLDLVKALTGPDSWGVETTTDGGRVVWARLDLPAAE